MKAYRIVCACLIAVMLLSCCEAEYTYDYDSLYNQLRQEVELGYFLRAESIYKKIKEIWPEATDRRGDTDNLGQYAEAWVAMDNKAYNDACRLFGSLPSDFGSEYDGLISADLMKLYCEAQRYLIYGRTKEAMASFLKCSGILDSSQMVGILSKGQELLLIGPEEMLIDSNSISVMWEDMASDTDTYAVTCMPKGTESRTKSLQVTDNYALITDLIPETEYTVYITPYKGGIVNGKSISANYKTERAKAGSQTVQADKLELYKYDVNDKKLMNAIQNDSEYFLASYFMNHLSKYTCIKEGETMLMPYSLLEVGKDGYILRCNFRKMAQSVESVEIKIVLRTGNGCSYDYDKTVKFDDGTGYGGFCIYLDDMLDEIFTDNDGWPTGNMFIDVYADNFQIKRMQYKLDTAG